MALSKLNLQHLRDVCQEKDIDHSGLHRKKDLIERINENREARQATVEDDDVENEAEREMMRERVELGFQGEEMRDAGAFVTNSLTEIKFQKMVEQTNDVLSFFNVFEKTCNLHGIQGQHVSRILPSLLNEKANKIYSRLDIDTC